MPADEAILRILLEGAGGEAGAGGGTPRAGVTPGAGAREGATPREVLLQEFEAFGRKLAELRAALDPDVLRQRVQQSQEVLLGQRALASAEFAERQRQGIGPPTVDLGADILAYYKKLEELQAQLDPALVAQYARATVDITLAERRLAEARAAAVDKLAPAAQVLAEPLTDVAALLGRQAEELQRLHEALDPEFVRQQAAMELALMEARQKAAGALAEEMERQVPTAIPVPEPLKPPEERGLLGHLFDFARHMRGTLGGVFGPAAGGGLDAANAFAALRPQPTPVVPVRHVTEAQAAGLPEVQAAEGGGGAAAGAGAAVAGAAAVVIALYQALKALQQVVNSTITAVGGLAAAAASADTDIARNFESVGSQVQKTAEEFFYLNPALSIFAGALGTAASALGQVMAAADGMSERFAQFSPELALAEARSEITQFFGDLRRSQEVAPGLTRYVEERTRLQQQFEDVKIRLFTKMLPAIIRTMQVAEAVLAILTVWAQHDPFLAGLSALLPKLDDINKSVQGLQDDKEFALMGDFILNNPTLDPFAPGGFERPPAEGAS